MAPMRRAIMQQKITAQWRRACVASAALDARIMMRHVVGCSDSRLIAKSDLVLSPREYNALMRLTSRRAAHIPMSRLRGRREFYGLEFLLARHVFDPRPDSETLVDTASAFIRSMPNPQRVLELGSGSGALLISLLTLHPTACGLGVDISRVATRLARLNAARLGVGERACFRHAHWRRLLPLHETKTFHFDMLIANPPYISDAEMRHLPREITAHDPHRALYGGDDGLMAYRDILSRLIKCDLPKQKPPPILIFEIGATQAKSFAKICADHCLPSPKIHHDLADNARVAVTYLTKN